MRWTPAGKRRQFITIQSLVTAPDQYGQASPTPSTFATAYASVRQLSGRELFYAQQVQSLATHKVNLRYIAGVLPTMQILVEGISQPLQILAVNDLEMRHRELELDCVLKS